MANAQPVTVCNNPRVENPDGLEVVLDKYDMGMGPFDAITASVNYPNTDVQPDAEPTLSLYGYSFFEPVHIPTALMEAEEAIIEDPHVDNEDADDPDAVEDYAQDIMIELRGHHTRKFLHDIAPFLTEPLDIRTVSHEKCRYPVLGQQWLVWPDGTIRETQFDHDHTHPNERTPRLIVDGRFTSEGISVSVYDTEYANNVVDETWFTYDEIDAMKSDGESHFTFELGEA